MCTKAFAEIPFFHGECVNFTIWQQHLQLFFLSAFFSIWVFFHKHSRSTGQQEKGMVICFLSSLTHLPASQTYKHKPGDYSRELASACSQQPESDLESLAAKHKSLTTKLHFVAIAIIHYVYHFFRIVFKAPSFVKKIYFFQSTTCCRLFFKVKYCFI